MRAVSITNIYNGELAQAVTENDLTPSLKPSKVKEEQSYGYFDLSGQKESTQPIPLNEKDNKLDNSDSKLLSYTLTAVSPAGTYLFVKNKGNTLLKDIRQYPVKKLIIPIDITVIPEYYFYPFENLEEIEFLAEHVSISQYAFPPTNKIKTIKGKNMSITKRAFSNEEEPNTYHIYEDIIKFYDFTLKIDYYSDYKFAQLDNIEINPKELHKYIYYSDPYAKTIMTQILTNFPEDKMMADLVNIYNEEAFLKNLELINKVNGYFYRPGIILDDNIVSLFINNKNLFHTPIEDSLVQNYLYLVSQSSIPKEKLRKLYLGGIDSIDDFNQFSAEGILHQIFTKGISLKSRGPFELPELFQTLIVNATPSNKLELLDRLTYVETMGLLDSNNVEDQKNAVRMLKRTNFDNIVEVDQKDFSEETSGIYDSVFQDYEIFDSVKLALYEKMNGINKSIFPLFIDSLEDKRKDSIIKNFLSSLTTVKKWNEFTDLKHRATCLKNEIIARILYGLLKSNDPNKSKTEEELLSDLRNDVHSLIRVIPKITGDSKDIFKEEKYITMMLKIDPYSFDALRSHSDIPSDLECKYWIHARENNYLFTKEETKRYYKENKNAQYPKNETRLALSYPGVRHSDSNEIHDIREFINNEIGIPKVSKKAKETYLRKVREMARSYINNHSDEELLTFLKSIDLYMRSSNEYTIQQHTDEKAITAIAMFDKSSDIPKEDRLLYVLYNLNQIAHSTTERNLLYDVHHKYRIDAVEQEKEGKVLTSIIKNISDLMRYGLSYEEIILITEGKRNIDLKILGELPSSPEYLVDYLNDTCITSEVVIPITLDNINSIKDKFKYLRTNLYVNNRISKVKNYAQERFTFFETKRIIADELIRKFTKEIDGELIEIAFASKEDKQEFYAKHGLIVEIQLDKKEVTKDGVTITENNPVLVCYSEQFNETFSIHLKELDKKYLDKFQQLVENNQLVETISNTVLRPPGLSLRNKKIRKKQQNGILPKLEGKFISRNERKEMDYAVAFYNYFTYDVERIKYQNHEKIKYIKELLIKDSLTAVELVTCREQLEELSNLKDSTYYTRFVNSEKELNEDYEKIFGCKLPEDVFGLSSIQTELKLLHQKLLVHLFKQRQETQKSFRV